MEKLVLIWTFVGFTFVFLPGTLQIKFLEGWEIPLALLSSIGIVKISSLVRKKWSIPVLITFITLILIPSIYIAVTDFKEINIDNKNSYNYHVSNGEYEGFNWLKKNSDKNDVILSNWFMGNLIPGLTGRQVLLGNVLLTPNFDDKISQINLFLLQNNDTAAKSFLRLNGIKYIFLGNYDSMLSYGFKPDLKPYLKLVYSKEGVLIYKVIDLGEANPIYMLPPAIPNK